MPEFSSIADLSNYISKQYNTNTVQGNLLDIIKKEAIKLQALLRLEIDNYYQSYTPVYYTRTYDWVQSIRVSEPKIEGKQIDISIYFDDAMANHPSVMGSSQPDGYVPWLMEDGWKNRSLTTPHFQGFHGTHYIKNAIDKYNSTNTYGLKIHVFHNGELYI